MKAIMAAKEAIGMETAAGQWEVVSNGESFENTEWHYLRGKENDNIRKGMGNRR